jgi:MFS family permease
VTLIHVQPAHGAKGRASIRDGIRRFFAYDRRALFTLLVCVLSLASAQLDPPFLGLTSDDVQKVLQRPDSRAPLLVALGFLVLALITLIGGVMGDLLGRRRVLLAGLSAVVAANVLGGFTAGTLWHIPVFALKTMALGFVAPMCVAILTLTFERGVRPFAFGILFGAQTLAVVLSSFLLWLARLSGALWWSFAPAVIVGIAAIWLVTRYLPESDPYRRVHLPSALVTVFLLALTFLFIFIMLAGGALLRNWWLVLLAAGALVIVMAGRLWLRRLSSFLKTDLEAHAFNSRDLVLAIVAGVIVSGVQIAFLFEFGAFSREVQQTGSFFAALRLAPYVIGVLAGSILIQQLTVRFGAPVCIAGGMALMAVSLLSLSLIQPETPFLLLLLPITLLGLGYGVATPARAQVILSASPAALVGASAAIKTATSQLGSALGVTTATVVITQLANATYLAAAQTIGAGQAVRDQVQQPLTEAIAQAAETVYAIPATAVGIVTSGVTPSYAHAWTSGLGELFMWLGVATLIGAGTVYIVMVRRAEAAPPSAAVPPASDASPAQSA